MLVFYIEDAFRSHNPFYRWRRLLREVKKLAQVRDSKCGKSGVASDLSDSKTRVPKDKNS